MADPRAMLPEIGDWLELGTGEEALAAMLHPENSPFARPGPANAPLGNDIDFLQSPFLRDYDGEGREHSNPETLRQLDRMVSGIPELARDLGY